LYCGRAHVICDANQQLADYYAFARVAADVQKIAGPGVSLCSRSTSMKLSARNSLPGIVRKIAPGAVNAEVTIELAPGLIVVSVITLDAVQSLQLKVGDRAYAVIKASSVMIAVD
jgi:molybdopterin-binding protein